MSFINWNDDYSVGDSVLDNHHKHLFSLLEDVSSLLSESSIDERLAAILVELVAYTEYHFKAEEDRMIASNYIHYSNHKEAHDAFIKKIKELNLSRTTSAYDSLDDLFLFLNQWLVSHIMTEDKKYVNLI